MLDPYEFITGRHIRYSIVGDNSNDVSQVLRKFGLKQNPMKQLDKKIATEILANLLWKDMAHSSECMSKKTADHYAAQIVEENSDSKSQYFSNRSSIQLESWDPFTESTFDSGLVIAREDGRYFCIWFEDED